MSVKKRFEISVISALILCLLISFARYQNSVNAISRDVFRLHILANSDSYLDQSLKLKVRDEILKSSEEIFSKCKSKREAMAAVKKNKQRLINTAQATLKNNGCTLPVSAEVTKCRFERRDYESFSLPPGYYDALRIKIGRGKGHNWWCVIFPKVCVGAAADITENMPNSEKDIVNNPDDYKIKFRISELIYDLRETIRDAFT